MDWYDRIQHDLGCSLAYIRDFVSPDMICSCYQHVLDKWKVTEESRLSWLDGLTLVYPMYWRPAQVDTVPYYNTGALHITKKTVGGPFRVW